MKMQIRQQNGIAILEPSGKIVGSSVSSMSIRLTVQELFRSYLPIKRVKKPANYGEL